MLDYAWVIVGSLFVLAPILVIPTIIGVIILQSFRDEPFGRLVGFFTLKPLLASPLLGVILVYWAGQSAPGDLAPWVLLPGCGLTLLILWKFIHLYFPPAKLAYLFLAADVLRWGNTYIMASLPGPQLEMSPEALPVFYASFGAACVLPSAYAIMALVILIVRRNRRRMAAQEPAAIPVL